MREALREYGPITALIVVAMIGYGLYDHNRDDLLNYSLDAIGSQLMNMVDGPEEGQQMVAGMYSDFKERVMAREVTPEQVETMAANVFNLSHSQSTLTPEQAELVLKMTYMAPDNLLRPDAPPPAPQPLAPGQAGPAPLAPRPPKAVYTADLASLGERLETMIAFETTLQDIAATGAMDTGLLAGHMKYEFDEGLHLVMDGDIDKAALAPEAQARLNQAMKRLERKKLVVHKPDLARRIQAEQTRIQRELASLVAMKGQMPEHDQKREALAMLEAFKHLQAMGYRTVDSLGAMQITLSTEEIEAVVDEVIEAATESINTEGAATGVGRAGEQGAGSATSRSRNSSSSSSRSSSRSDVPF